MQGERGAPAVGARRIRIGATGVGEALDDQGSLEERAYAALADWLMRGEGLPGQVVPLRALAARLGMSRTPLRAAVGRLREQGLVDLRPPREFVVATPTAKELLDLFELRLMYEFHALRRFLERPAPPAPGRRGLPDEIARLADEIWEVAGQIVDEPARYPEFVRLDAQFHRAIVALADNPRLLAGYDQLHLKIHISRLGLMVPFTPERFRSSADDHLRVVRAVRTGRDVEAREVLEAHAIRARDRAIARMVAAQGSGTWPAEPAWLRSGSPGAGNGRARPLGGGGRRSSR